MRAFNEIQLMALLSATTIFPKVGAD